MKTLRSESGSLSIGGVEVPIRFGITIRDSCCMRGHYKNQYYICGTICNAVLSWELRDSIHRVEFSVSGGTWVSGAYGVLSCDHCVFGGWDMNPWSMKTAFAEQEFVECDFKFAVNNPEKNVLLEWQEQ